MVLEGVVWAGIHPTHRSVTTCCVLRPQGVAEDSWPARFHTQVPGYLVSGNAASPSPPWCLLAETRGCGLVQL